MLSKIITQENIHRVEKLLDRYDRIVIVTHTSPDGDAIGSSLGLYHLLNILEKEVRIVVNTRVPSSFKWLAGVDEIIVAEDYKEFAEEVISKAQLIFCLDFNTTRRMGAAVEEMVLSSQAKRVLVDHHPNPQNFTNVVISHPDRSSTSELVFRLICRLGYYDRIDLPCAEALYTGMMCDTGNFSYNSNDPELYFIIAELLNKEINKDLIYANVFGAYQANRMKLMGFVLYEKMKVYQQAHAALITLTSDEMKQHNNQVGDTEGFVNLPLNIKGIHLSGFFREESGRIKVSLRSRGTFDVNQVCQKYFNGGGHKNASGGELFCTMDEAIALFERILPDYRQELIQSLLG